MCLQLYLYQRSNELSHTESTGRVPYHVGHGQQMPFAEEVCDGCTVRRYPTVVRDMLEFNGLAIGFDAAARNKHLMQEVAILEERAARLIDVQTIVGRPGCRTGSNPERSRRSPGVFCGRACLCALVAGVRRDVRARDV